MKKNEIKGKMPLQKLALVELSQSHLTNLKGGKNDTVIEDDVIAYRTSKSDIIIEDVLTI